MLAERVVLPLALPCAGAVKTVTLKIVPLLMLVCLVSHTLVQAPQLLGWLRNWSTVQK